MLKITSRQLSTNTTAIVLEGTLSHADCGELLSAVEQAKQRNVIIELDLSCLRYADGEGLSLLRGLTRDGIVTRSASPFVSELLKQS